MSEQKDISMVDVSDALDSISRDTEENNHENPAPPVRRKSTLIFTDENDVDKMNVEQSQAHASTTEHQSPQSQHSQAEALQQLQQLLQPQQQSQSQSQSDPDPNVTVPVDIKWVQGGEKVYVTGSFTGWRKMIGLQKQQDGTMLVTLGLPVGTHRFRFVVDNELRFSDFLPTATDQMGNFVNYIEVTPEHIRLHLKRQQELDEERHEQEEQEKQKSQPRGRSMSLNKGRNNSMFGLINDDDDMGNGYSRYHDEDGDQSFNNKRFNYINDIPPIFVDPKVMEQYYLAIDEQAKSKNGQQQAWLHPPQLPPHLENVILNNFNSQDRDNNSGALPIPNHVVLNHLATTSIKHNTLAVASVVRYKRKYVTQVLYAPLQQ
ncbi:CIC11C00000003814 [Sungouiella intermedia]|uniref:CIC11C00000003814 n=1 Tax=Sungouiella intermedia TaxID=45354 RepID=A0A1L0GJN6_9ASCO|nr:CIC11C00000003814 [[Candida] intermedia]